MNTSRKSLSSDPLPKRDIIWRFGCLIGMSYNDCPISAIHRADSLPASLNNLSNPCRRMSEILSPKLSNSDNCYPSDSPPLSMAAWDRAASTMKMSLFKPPAA